ncbi:MAG: water stress/hypersensitive response [Geobacteraceae bacterium]|nr:MAG: water stress/hypersensitive response [Geobacteraceae bacterium]
MAADFICPWEFCMKKLLVLLVLFLSGCTILVTDPEVTVRNASIVGLDTKGFELEFYLTVKNPNSFGVTLKGYNYDLQVMTLPIAKGGARNRVEFKAGSTTDVRLPVRVEFSDLLEILKRRPDFDRIPYRLNAGLELDTPLGELLVPLDKSDTFAVPQEYRPSYLLKQVTDLFSSGK